jgi:hypothetical protein
LGGILKPIWVLDGANFAIFSAFLKKLMIICLLFMNDPIIIIKAVQSVLIIDEIFLTFGDFLG